MFTYDGLDAYSNFGHTGDPTYATEELGERVTDRLVAAVADRIERERGDDE